MLVCLVLIAPLLWLLLLSLLWAAPLRASSQRSLLRAAERCFAWAALDVFVLTTLHPNPNPNPHPHQVGTFCIACAILTLPDVGPRDQPGQASG